MYEIYITEKKYINSEDSSVKVSFQLTGHDWSELSQSPQWKAVENFLSQKKSTDLYQKNQQNTRREATICQQYIYQKPRSVRPEQPGF